MASLGLRSTAGIRFQTGRVCSRANRNGPGRVRVGPARCMAAGAIKVAPGGTHVRGEPEKLDRWVKESVSEIVRNLQEAPLFVHVYSGPGTRLKTEKAVEEEWSHMKGKWVKGEEPSPEGIILVEELKEDNNVGLFEEDEGQNGDSTKAWGLLIQGKGEDGGVACYLLKTSKVECGNLGLFCTHFCLVRVKSFRETAKSQLTKCWLA